MPAIRRAKTAFTAGELAPELLGRGDISAWTNGAARLRNVFIQPTGGVQRRPGLRHLANLPGPARLIPFEASSDQTYLLALVNGAMWAFQGDSLVAILPGPWTEAALPQITFTQNASMLLLLHRDMRPQAITRSDAGVWGIADFAFSAGPFARHAPAGVTLATSGMSGSVTVSASAPVFNGGHGCVEEHRRKISDTMRGIKRSVETRQRMSDSKKGRVFSDETRQRMREAQQRRRAAEKGDAA
ncbi:NUMOD3 domain-containing DNA-binding protein [Roseomonas harenae]|uniref:NUMOD3 domain-containing DNA-binding protein n=1 Tax=Muricoccus harenae TaxID=2692566 RepID=UPI0013316F92|nr:NUMOD3 domain-containing DNA-binding protein [Roseomonas harenae]